jgi:hypothetical protein
MTEQPPSTDLGSREPEAESDVESDVESVVEAAAVEAETPTTGVPAVDRVVSDLDRLDDAPLDEHLAAFERAHESLRSALDAPSSDQPGDSD